jgi:hypothetical protein
MLLRPGVALSDINTAARGRYDLMAGASPHPAQAGAARARPWGLLGAAAVLLAAAVANAV